MRTTLTLEENISIELDQIAHDSRRSFKSVVNEVLRAGLEVRKKTKVPEFREKPAAMGLRWEYEDKLNQAVDRLAIEDYLNKEGRE